jgi:hypothetical protein
MYASQQASHHHIDKYGNKRIKKKNQLQAECFIDFAFRKKKT